MPASNHFRHQVYSRRAPTAEYEFVQPAPSPALGSAEYQVRMRAVGRQLRAAGVEAIVLVHGTFVGDDTWGVHHGLDRFLPRFSNWSRRSSKRLADWFMQDITNYPPDYVETLRAAINEPDQPPIAVQSFIWSGMNNHIGRLVGAIELIDSLRQAQVARGKRILVWGHSHAGNVMALLTNLLGADRAELQRLRDTASVYYRNANPRWSRVLDGLMQNERPLADVSLDLVTFGTPIRYGWDSDGYGQLLHFVNHHPFDKRRPYRTRPPRNLTDLLTGHDGDYVQQLGIAGSNLVLPFVLRNFVADRRLSKMLAQEHRCFQVWRKVRQGMRVADEGKTLLVAYPREPSRWIDHFMGHGPYTLKKWMLFNAEEMVKQLY